jgi:hypothetical protein
MHTLIHQADRLLKGRNFEYAFCGGMAIDLFLGRETRRHGDVDVSIYWPDRDAVLAYMQSAGFEVYEMLGGGKAHRITDLRDQRRVKRNFFCCTADCEWVEWNETGEDEVFAVCFQPIGQSELNFIECICNSRTDTDFLYARDNGIRRALSKAILLREDIPYLSPELCLLYKSTDTERKGYQQDYDNAISQMDAEQKQWLRQALNALYPQGHKWAP